MDKINIDNVTANLTVPEYSSSWEDGVSSNFNEYVEILKSSIDKLKSSVISDISTINGWIDTYNSKETELSSNQASLVRLERSLKSCDSDSSEYESINNQIASTNSAISNLEAEMNSLKSQIESATCSWGGMDVGEYQKELVDVVTNNNEDNNSSEINTDLSYDSDLSTYKNMQHYLELGTWLHNYIENGGSINDQIYQDKNNMYLEYFNYGYSHENMIIAYDITHSLDEAGVDPKLFMDGDSDIEYDSIYDQFITCDSDRLNKIYESLEIDLATGKSTIADRLASFKPVSYDDSLNFTNMWLYGLTLKNGIGMHVNCTTVNVKVDGNDRSLNLVDLISKNTSPYNVGIFDDEAKKPFDVLFTKICQASYVENLESNSNASIILDRTSNGFLYNDSEKTELENFAQNTGKIILPHAFASPTVIFTPDSNLVTGPSTITGKVATAADNLLFNSGKMHSAIYNPLDNTLIMNTTGIVQNNKSVANLYKNIFHGVLSSSSSLPNDMYFK